MKRIRLNSFINSIVMLVLVYTMVGGRSDLAAVLLKTLNPAKYYNKAGTEAFSSNDFNQAAFFYRQVLTYDTENPKGYNNLANALHHLEEYDRAEEYFNHAIELATKNNKNPDKSLTSVTETENLLLSQLYYNLGNHYLERSAYPKAITSYKKSLNYNNKDLQTKKNLELALNRFINDPQAQQQQLPQHNQNLPSGSNNQTETPQPNKPAPTPPNPDNEETTDPSQKSQDSLEQGRDQKLSSSQNNNLPQEAQNNNKPPKNNQTEPELISQKRASEILASFEERHKNFNKLDSQPHAPNRYRRSKIW
ncbi:hypothetical protein COTS27_00541 [Spirochaetota bacterium]|nr:hypothetical protein COTS27_00541 [Spirochaetota bacterium]